MDGTVRLNTEIISGEYWKAKEFHKYVVGLKNDG